MSKSGNSFLNKFRTMCTYKNTRIHASIEDRFADYELTSEAKEVCAGIEYKKSVEISVRYYAGSEDQIPAALEQIEEAMTQGLAKDIYGEVELDIERAISYTRRVQSIMPPKESEKLISILDSALSKCRA